MSAETVHHFKRGDRATTRTYAGSTVPAETVTIVRAEYMTRYNPAEGRERWLHVRFDSDGARLVTHPSNLIPA